MKFPFLLLMSVSAYIHAHEVIVRSPEGDLFVTHVEPDASYVNVVEHLQGSVGSNGEYLLDFMVAGGEETQEEIAKSPYRNYNIPITPKQKSDIALIVNTLGQGSLAKIAKSKKELTKAGDRLDQVHPFRFLMCIFTDDEMKASLLALSKRFPSWMYNEFLAGVKSSSEEEANRNNLAPYINDFAHQVGVSPDLITPAINQRQWTQLVQILIDNVPRNGNPGRYNM